MMHDQIQQLKLEDVIGDRFGRYSKYVIQDRAIPDVRDGLKPVQRRILYAMYKDGNTFDKNFRKSAKTVGNVIGNYHPHGESSIYDAMVRLGQDWKMREELILIHGNKGSVDGDPAAAMRYTEAKLSKLSGLLLEDLNKETVDFINNFDDTEVEPTVLPAKFPNLLVNGTTGISAGYATDIPPHNLGEVIEATLKLIEKPSVSLDELLEVMPGPDFPTGGIIQGKKELKKAYETGKGRIIVRSRMRVEEARGNKKLIIIDEIPFEVNKANLVKKIDEIIFDKKVDGMIEVRDETDRDGMRVVIEVRKDANIDAIKSYLLMKTDLQVSYNFNMVAIDQRAPKLLGLKAILNAYIAHQKDVVARRSRYMLNHAEKRIHIIEGLIRALSVLDEVIRIIRESQNKKDAKENLIAAFDFTETQAEAIVMLQLYRLTNTDIVELETEHNELEYEINQLKEILSNDKKLMSVIKRELKDVKKEFTTARRTDIEDKIESLDVSKEMLIAKEDTVVSLTRDGYIKRTSPRSYNASPFDELGMKEDDHLLFMHEGHTLETLIVFTSKGNYMIIPVHELPDIRWKDNGVHLSSKYNLKSNEVPVFALEIESFDEAKSIIITTANGQVKRTTLDLFEMTRISRPIASISLKKEDSVVSVDLVENPDDEMLFVTTNGLTLRYGVSEINSTGLRTQGVRAMNLKDKDRIVYGGLIKDNKVLITASQRGALKRTPIDEFKSGARAQVGSMLLKDIKSKPHRIVGATLSKENINVILHSEKEMETFNSKEVRQSGRYANGSFVVDEDSFGQVVSVDFEYYTKDE
ncbi:DNA topoisomerase IV subunit A [Phocicoccus pinnipedialis]|uniref:DNA topoisomerase 4 subunit A n=2 Tax=Phocicoccus pinnipedialis TaxID=110845 RepID=A0A6V7REI3_9BACL|nr:topoisomerase-4 subunit A [Jeotgalicoccus pinnipedialis]CAD2075409.1 DNA topoisomerase 4 subunit A [Jeotgalicoccus pinnipedialis]